MDGHRRTEFAQSRARAVRAEADALRAHAAMTRKQADAVLGRLLDSLRRFDAKPVGDRGEGTFSLRLVRRPEAVAFARYDLRRWLERDGVSPEIAAEIALACSEACSNAVEHAEAPMWPVFEIEAKREPDILELVVRDFGSWSETSETSSTRGRGLQMIRAIMDEVEVTSSAGGTQVLMRRSLGDKHD
jgi:anti-sigma regulatory factor (Ser/Thr protein kinase)